jgi:small conductance mechanosensitive channel
MNTVLDPQKLTGFGEMAWAWAFAFLPQLAVALAILIIGTLVAGWAGNLVRSLAARSGRVDPTLLPVFGTVVRYGITILVIVAALGQLGIQTASLLAVLGAAGLAIGLALQGTLTNISAGIMLLWLRPFKVGDYIEVGGISGTVREIGLFACHIDTLDGLFLFAPNAAIWNTALRNYSRNPGRLIVLQVKLPAKGDLARAQSLLKDMAAADPRFLATPAPAAHIEAYADGNAVISFRAWAAHATVGALQRGLIDAVRQKFEAEAVPDLVPLQVTRLLPTDADPTRLIEE